MQSYRAGLSALLNFSFVFRKHTHYAITPSNLNTVGLGLCTVDIALEHLHSRVWRRAIDLSSSLHSIFHFKGGRSSIDLCRHFRDSRTTEMKTSECWPFQTVCLNKYVTLGQSANLMFNFPKSSWRSLLPEAIFLAWNSPNTVWRPGPALPKPPTFNKGAYFYREGRGAGKEG